MYTLSKIVNKKPHRNIKYKQHVRGAPIYDLFNLILEISKGNKCPLVRIPKVIRKTTIKNKNSFLIGLFVALAGRAWREDRIYTRERAIAR